MTCKAAFIFLSSLATGFAQTPKPLPAADLTKNGDYRQAQKAVRDGLAEAAVPRLEKLVRDPLWKGALGYPARLLLAEAMVRTGRGSDALKVLAGDAGGADQELLFWTGLAQAAAGQFTAADETLARIKPAFVHSNEAALTRASILTVLGQPAGVMEVLQPLMKSSDPVVSARARLATAGFMLEAGRTGDAASILGQLSDPPARYAAQTRYLQAQVALAQGRAQEAAPVFALLEEGGRGISRDMRHAAALGFAIAIQRQGRPGEALAALEKLIGQSPAPPLPLLQNAFALFEELNNPPTPEAESFLQNWARSTEPGLQTLARLALAAILDNGGRAAEALSAVRAACKDAPDGPLKAGALLREARLCMAAADREGARAALDQLRPLATTPALKAWAAWMEGAIQFESQRWSEAAREFTRAALESNGAASQAASAYNAALAELRGGVNDPRTALGVLDSVGAPDSAAAMADFQLERALYLAGKGDPEAATALKNVLLSLPNHPRRFDALAAGFELDLKAPTPPDEAKRKAMLAELESSAQGDAARETLSWLKVSAARMLESGPAFEAAALAYIETWPASARLPVLRMWLGESLYQRRKFALARTQFETLATAAPQHALAEAALFWAARSALLNLGTQSEKEAIDLWEQVYKKGGPLKLEARLQVAQLNQRRNDHAAALQLFASILEAKPENALRWQVLCARGEVLVAQQTSAATITQGLASFDEVAAEPGVTQAWKHEALVRKGACLEQLKRQPESLAAWHSVLTDPPGVADAARGGDYWFHRAGEKAIRYLENAGKYNEAVQVARRLAAAPGPRGKEALALMDSMALKYDIWIERSETSP